MQKLVLSLLVSICAPLVASAQSTLSPAADAYVRDGDYSASNFGSDVQLAVRKHATLGFNRESYIKFDTTSVTTTITSAKLRLYGYLSATTSTTVSIHPVSSTSWTESGITWANKSAMGATALSSLVMNSTSAAWREFDITSYVNSERSAGRRVIAVGLKGSDLSFAYFNSKEAASNQPQLAINGGGAVNTAPTVSLTSPANGTTYAAPASIALNASASDSDGTISKVEFIAGTTVLGTDTSNPYAITWGSVAAGSYSLTARATDNGGATKTSSGVNVTVNASSSSSSSGGGSSGHPRLFITSTRINELKSAIAVAGSSHQEMYNAMKARVDLNDWTVYDESSTDGNYNYGRAWLGMEASMMYLLTSDTKYSTIAYNSISSMYTNPDPDGRLPYSGYGLARAHTGLGLAMAYDFCYNGLTSTQRTDLLNKINQAIDAWASFSHTNLGSPYTSNWVAVCRGAELIEILASSQEGNRSARYGQLKSWLNSHMNNSYGNQGWMNEGTGYADYSGMFLVPAVLAARSIGDTGMDTAFNGRSFYKQPMYAYSFGLHSGNNHKVLMSGVDGGGPINNEGWASQLLGTVPSTSLPQYLYFYDRYQGKFSTLSSANRYDNERGGTVFAMIYYPQNVTASNPAGTFGAINDSKGAFYFRKSWQDANDIMVSLMGDFVYHNPGWNTEEAFQLGLVAYNTQFIGGPGKGGTGSTAVHTGFSCLTVDGKAFSTGSNPGASDTFTPSTDGGYVIVDGGAKYKTGLGLTSAKRHMLVDFSTPASPAIISTLDRITDDVSHTYAWQINLGDDTSNGGVTATTGTEAGRSTFTLRGNNNGYVKAWVLHPSNAAIASGDPLKVSTTGSNADIWVVMIVGSGTPPAGSISGTGLSTVLTVNGASVSYNATSNRIVSQ